jgi:hypothetical protein
MSTVRLFSRHVTLAGLLALSAAVSTAQASTALLAGRVSDTTGGVLPGVSVSATNLRTALGSAVVTNDEGLYLFASLPPGEYRVEAQLTGFRSAVRPRVVLNVDARATLDFELDLGEVTEVVTVEGGLPLVNVSSAAVSTVVDRQFVENLPLNGRSFQSLLELTPGVVLAEASIFAPGQFAINGQRTNANYFMVDGVGANVGVSASAQAFQQAAGTQPGLTILGGTNSLASVDALEEFRVQTSTYSAEYGRTPGGQVSVVTRSGGARHNASAYNYFRNEALDANDWFFNRDGLGKLPLRQNLFGGVLGGPVGIPGLFERRAGSFFFASYEGLRLRQPQPDSRSVRVPSLEARQAATGALRDVFNAFPVPNAPAQPGDPALTARYLLRVSNPSSFDAWSVKLDQHIAGTRLFGRFSSTPSQSSTRVFANQVNRNEINTWFLTMGGDWRVGRLLGETRVNYTGASGEFFFRNLEVDGAALMPDSVLFPAGSSKDEVSVLLQLIPDNFNPTSLNRGRTLGNENRQVNVIQHVTLLTGRHQLKAGVDYRRLMPKAVSRAFTYSYNFLSVESALERNGPASVSISAFAPPGTFYFNNVSAYVQDTWRATERLTVDLGLRYDFNPPPGGNRPYTLNGLDNPLTATLAEPGSPQWQTDKKGFAPRVGAVYRLSAPRDMVLRGGFGIYYDLGTSNATRGYASFPSTSSRVVQRPGFPASPETLTSAPRNLNPPYQGSFDVFEPGFRLPYTMQWSLGFEQALGTNQAFSVTYVGAAGRRLARREVYRNQPANATQGTPAITVLNPALFGPSTFVFHTRNLGESNYRALQAQYQRRLLRGLQALVSYTWGYSEDNASDDAASQIPTSGFEAFPVTNRLEFGPSDFDIRHSLAASVTYDVPSPRGAALLRTILGGWGLDAIGRFRTGTPINVITQAIDPLNVATTRRVDVVAGEPIWLSDRTYPGGKRLNPAAFALPPVGQQGNLARNSIRSFNVWQIDVSARRTFRLTSGVRLQVRGDVFNLFNHPNFAEPNQSWFPSPGVLANFGLSTRMLSRQLGAGGTAGGFNPLFQIGGPRSVQLSARVSFW